MTTTVEALRRAASIVHRTPETICPEHTTPDPSTCSACAYDFRAAQIAEELANVLESLADHREAFEEAPCGNWPAAGDVAHVAGELVDLRRFMFDQDDDDESPVPSTRDLDAHKAQIVDAVRAGVIPLDVADFGALHDFVDANEFTLACPDFAEVYASAEDAEDWIPLANAIQGEIDTWIKGGGILSTLAGS